MEGKVFWYYVGNRAEHLVIDGEPSLVTPHSYFLAPSNVAIPAHARHLFKQKNPPADIAAKFGVAPEIAAERQKIVEAETVEVMKSKEEAPREGKPTEPLPMEKAIREVINESHGGDESKSESRRERKERERKDRESQA